MANNISLAPIIISHKCIRNVYIFGSQANTAPRKTFVAHSTWHMLICPIFSTQQFASRAHKLLYIRPKEIPIKRNGVGESQKPPSFSAPIFHRKRDEHSRYLFSSCTSPFAPLSLSFRAIHACHPPLRCSGYTLQHRGASRLVFVQTRSLPVARRPPYRVVYYATSHTSTICSNE